MTSILEPAGSGVHAPVPPYETSQRSPLLREDVRPAVAVEVAEAEAAQPEVRVIEEVPLAGPGGGVDPVRPERLEDVVATVAVEVADGELARRVDAQAVAPDHELARDQQLVRACCAVVRTPETRTAPLPPSSTP